jgi:RNA polymerase subunit RPABC4/transcription elongation factor Spt4
VQDDFQVCPSCLTKLRRQCHFCNHLLAPEWSLCPYCGR